MNPLKIMLDGLKISPYPFWYTLLYPYYAKHPSFKNHGKMPLFPIKKINQDITNAYRLVFFGDLFAIDNIPTVEPELVEIFSNADLIFGNLECPIIYSSFQEWKNKNAEGGLWKKSISEEFILKLLTNMQINPRKLILSVANNHAQDWGDSGLKQTITSLAKNNITAAGVFQNNSAGIVEIKLNEHFSINVIAWTNWLNKTAGLGFSNPNQFRVTITSDILHLELNKNNKFLIALPHWDFEYQHFPNNATRQLAVKLADKGFNIVAGSHTHTIQPIEELSNDCYCLYSLGNLLNPGHVLSSSTSSDIGLIWEVFIDAAQKNISGYIAHPFIHNREKNQLTLLSASDSKYTKILNRVYLSE